MRRLKIGVIACGAIAQIQNLPHLRELCPAARASDAHTQWDREGGTRLQYRYGVSTRAERQARSSPRQSAEVLLERRVQACIALADSARENAAAQRTADRGSSRSRRKSPSTVMASALVASARPGSVASHHAVVR